MNFRIVDRITGAIIGALALALVAVMAGLVNAGPLDPPGAPGSTVGVLEPGTPISSLPFETTDSGYYYLTRNLTGTEGSAGITISHDNVTLDLKGFTLQGVGGSLDGIVAGGSNVIIRNGSIANWSGSGILTSFPTFSLGSTLYDLHVNNNGGYGIRAGSRTIIHDVTSRENALDGIATSQNAVIERCIVSGNGGAGINAPFNTVVSDCSVMQNGGDGIVGGQGSVVRSNSVTANGGDGIEVSAGSIVEQNTLLLNGQQVLDGAGIRATGGGHRIINNIVNNNDYGIAASSSLITGNYAQNNGDNYGQVTSSPFGPVLNILTIDDAGANPHANFE